MPFYTADVEQAPNRKCVLLVCPNNSQYNRASLRALMDAIARTHDSCSVRVFDTLSYHSYVAMGWSKDDAIDQAHKRGCEWIERYVRYQKRDEYKDVLSPEVMGWNQIRQLPSFEAKFAMAGWAYRNTEVGLAVDQYVDRHIAQVVTEGRLGMGVEVVRKTSTAYILEELAGKAAMIADIDQNRPFEIYSGHNALDPKIFERVSQRHCIDLRIHNYLRVTIHKEQCLQVA